jgi:nucleotide-binding universal stress UspA family protein
MSGFGSILAVLPEASEAQAALDHAIALARHDGASLTLVDVIALQPGETVGEAVIARHRERLARFAEQGRAEAVEPSEAVLQGTPRVEVIRMVLREGHDLVIKGAEAARPEAQRCVDMALLRECPCPVWLVRGPEGSRAARVVAMVGAAPTRRGLAQRVHDLAAALARRDAAELRVVTSALAAETALAGAGPAAVLVVGMDGVAEVDALLDRLTCSVVAVKPEGFVSPVRLERAG